MLIFVGCKPKQNMVYMSNHNFEEEISKAKYEGLKIHEGDVLNITVSAFDDIAIRPFNKSMMAQTAASQGDTSLQTADNNYTVTTEGYIVFPVLGDIYCKGMTKQALKSDLENRLKAYLTDPLVSVDLKNFNFSVLGDVSSPGQKTSNNERLNVFQALALSGDLNDSADRTNVKLIRYSDSEAKEKVVSLDLSEASIVNSPYYYLQQNDILYVEPDKNKQISANYNNPNRNLIFQIGSALIGLVGIIIAITK